MDSSCDDGYEGLTCDRVGRVLPGVLVAPMDNPASLGNNFVTVSGAELSYRCGIVGSGKAAVFFKSDNRLISTISMDTTGVRYATNSNLF